MPLGLVAFFAINLFFVAKLHNETSRILDSQSNEFPRDVEEKERGEEADHGDEADLIIRRSFEQSYALILPCEASQNKIASVKIAKECMEQTRDHIMSENIIVPWWFQTLLRDILGTRGGIYAWWHHFYTTKPPFHFCTVDKVATTEWR